MPKQFGNQNITLVRYDWILLIYAANFHTYTFEITSCKIFFVMFCPRSPAALPPPMLRKLSTSHKSAYLKSIC